MKPFTLSILMLASGLPGLSAAETAATDTLGGHKLRPLEVMGIKQVPDGGVAVEAVTRISGAETRRLGIESAKGVSIITPNFYMPDYGSRMTSSIYVRGLGARMDQPVVGLSVDNIPYLNKDNYDFDVADIESIDILRGAQSVLNGRNTMGGQINVRTFSPLRTKGLRAMAEFGSGNTGKAAVSYYGQFGKVLGMSLATQFKHSDGYFKNEYDGQKLDKENSGSMRWKTAWKPSEAFSITNTAVLSLNRQGGYPYERVATGEISYNDECSYRRTSVADGLTVAWAGKRVVVTSLTSVQYMDDRMVLDQDFTPEPYFTLTQARKEWAFTEDLFTRGSRGKYSWLGGVFAFGRRTSMGAPVTFKDTGIRMLIEQQRNNINPYYPISWDTREFVLDSDFTLTSGGVALYHESTWTPGNWRFEAGIRLDVEHTALSYHNFTDTGFSTKELNSDGSYSDYNHTDILIDDSGALDETFVEFMPKFTASYTAGDFKPYLTFSKAYKTGGYNTQMFSDVLQQRIMASMGIPANYTLEEIVAYKPEHSFNYEAGVHWTPQAVKAEAELTLFYIDCRNQQLTVFPPGTVTGRLMTNAGRTRNYGLELSASYHPFDELMLRASYGYTNATFRSYNDGRADYRGKHVPYAPENTLFAQIMWQVPQLRFHGITPVLDVNARCAGKIWWNEANTISQPFYCLPSCSLMFDAEYWNLRLWCENISNTHYSTFYFMSIGNEFVQRGTPRRFGATLRIKI
ncbi:MAG: TonB-dependent receptor [Muribaculaceae bacterium]|nr:TonB-dependent receptor [Muribaculaceae bacterium]